MAVVRVVADGTLVADHVRRAVTAWERTIGLLGRRDLAPQSGMWFEPATAIHTIGMRMRIDVVLLDRQRRIVALHPNVPPCRMIAHPRAHVVLELGAGALTRLALARGVELRLEDEPASG